MYRISRNGPEPIIDFDQVEAGFLGAAERVFYADDTKLLAVFVDDAHLGNTDLSIRARTGWDRWTVVKWSSGYGRFPPYFFFGPLLAIGTLGALLVVRLPPLLDMAHLLRMCGFGLYQ